MLHLTAHVVKFGKIVEVIRLLMLSRSSPISLLMFLALISFSIPSVCKVLHTCHYGYYDSSLIWSNIWIANWLCGIDLFIGRRLYGCSFYHYETHSHSLLGFPEPIVEGFVRNIVYHAEFVDGYSFGFTLRLVHES